jgi:Protein of unknown function (DUF4242)
LQAISRKSCDVLRNLGPEIQWVQSQVTDERIYCTYIAPNEEMIREHGKQGVPGHQEIESARDDRSDYRGVRGGLKRARLTGYGALFDGGLSG